VDQVVVRVQRNPEFARKLSAFDDYYFNHFLPYLLSDRRSARIAAKAADDEKRRREKSKDSVNDRHSKVIERYAKAQEKKLEREQKRAFKSNLCSVQQSVSTANDPRNVNSDTAAASGSAQGTHLSDLNTGRGKRGAEPTVGVQNKGISYASKRGTRKRAAGAQNDAVAASDENDRSPKVSGVVGVQGKSLSGKKKC
jgi:hypothetical protein